MVRTRIDGKQDTFELFDTKPRLPLILRFVDVTIETPKDKL